MSGKKNLIFRAGLVKNFNCNCVSIRRKSYRISQYNLVTPYSIDHIERIQNTFLKILLYKFSSFLDSFTSWISTSNYILLLDIWEVNLMYKVCQATDRKMTWLHKLLNNLKICLKFSMLINSKCPSIIINFPYHFFFLFLFNKNPEVIQRVTLALIFELF